MAQTFVLDATFRVTNRGLVLATRKWTAGIRVGQRVMLPSLGAQTRFERITAIETGRKLDEQGRPVAWIGLLLGDVPEGEIPQLQAQLRNGDTLTVHDPERAA